MGLKPLLIGELNPYGSDPRMALFPYPKNSSGWRLCHVVLGLTKLQYMRGFERVNLCSGKWSAKEAKLKAAEIVVGEPRLMVLLGAKVAKAFDIPFYPFAAGRGVLLLPHPSGRCRLWNDPGAVDKARLALEVMGALPCQP